MVLENMFGQMEGYDYTILSHTMVVGIRIKCMVEENTFGEMENVMMVNIHMTKSLVLVYFIGLMANNTKETG